MPRDIAPFVVTWNFDRLAGRRRYVET